MLFSTIIFEKNDNYYLIVILYEIIGCCFGVVKQPRAFSFNITSLLFSNVLRDSFFVSPALISKTGEHYDLAIHGDGLISHIIKNPDSLKIKEVV